ncbi:MAG: IclR family transcriptional regulator [Solirubrobacterales bacterium]|nr:IclR family transcriptional regulator [Solirubrobacterales bacterium]
MADGSDRYQVPAVVGAIKILDELAGRGDEGATQAGLVEATGLSKSTMHNLLSTLEAHDFVRRETDTRSYRLGPALIPLGAEAGRQVKLVRTAIDRIAPLAASEQLSFAVAQMIGRDRCRVIERFYPPEDVHVGITVGSDYGPLDGAIGKVILAAMDPARADRLIHDHELPAHTNSTITDPDRLAAEVDQARELGWAVSRGELNQNHAVAAGIHGPDGELALLLLAIGFPGDLDDAKMAETGRRLSETAAEISVVPVRRSSASS